MGEVSPLGPADGADLRPASGTATIGRAPLGEDCVWLTVMVAVTVVEALWWGADWIAGFAPAPFLATYLALAFAGLGSVLAARMMMIQPRAVRPNPFGIVAGTILVGIGASLFLPLKCAIPRLVPFWLDPPIATAERMLFGADPWMVVDHYLGWAIVPVDRLYGLWLPIQTLMLFAIIVRPPSRGKSRALIAYCLSWFLLGVAAAALLSSAGPIFYDRVFGSTEFAPLRATLHGRGAWVVLGESDWMWSSYALQKPGLVAGMSAVPSMHVAISVWMVLTARSLIPQVGKYAIAYALFIWVSSVQLGWHYVTDGAVGALGVFAIWAISDPIESAARRCFRAFQ